MDTDLLGSTLSQDESDILAVHTRLKDLLARDGLPPLAVANLRDALASTGIVVTDLGLEFEHLLDLGV